MKTQSSLLLCVCVGFSVFVCAQAQNAANLTFEPSFFSVGETVKVECKPAGAAVTWDNIKELKLATTATPPAEYTVTRTCGDTTKPLDVHTRLTVTGEFQVELKAEAKDSTSYKCSLATCDQTQVTYVTVANVELTDLNLAVPVLFENYPTKIFENNSVDITCQLKKTALVEGDELIIEHLLNEKPFETRWYNISSSNQIEGKWTFNPNDETKRGANTFVCSNVNKNRPDLKMTKLVTKLDVEYAITSLVFKATDENTVIPDGDEFKVELTKTSLKVECIADGNPAATYVITRVEGSEDHVKIDPKNQALAITYNELTTKKLRFQCEASNNYTVTDGTSKKTAFLNVYTNGSYRHEPTTLAVLLAAFVIARKLMI